MLVAVLLTSLVLLTPRSAFSAEKTILRAGHFANVTHAQALIGHELSRQGKGWFEARLGPQVEIQWFVYNAGPSAMEALFARSLELAYAGPNPALNAHLKSRGKEIRIVAGACSGGAALVVPPDGRIRREADFRGRRVGTPQFANTQDVAARAWLRAQGFRVTLTGGDVLVAPASNADLFALFQRRELDAVWTVEPWVSRLVLEGKGTVYLNESSLWPETGGRYVTAHLASSVRLLNEKPELLRQWLAAHIELTQWIQANPEAAKHLVNAALQRFTTRALPAATLERAWEQLELTWDPVRNSLLKSADDAHRLGFLRQPPDLSRIYDLKLLNSVLREKNLPEVF